MWLPVWSRWFWASPRFSGRSIQREWRAEQARHQRTDPRRVVSVGSPPPVAPPHETAISTNPASLSSLALGLAESHLGDCASHEFSSSAWARWAGGARILATRGLTQLLLANRTRSTAESIAAECGGTAFGLDELPAALRLADVAICATSASSPIFRHSVVREAMGNRSESALVMLDLSVPRNVDPAVAALPGVRLFDVDDLQIRLDESLAQRRREMPKVEAIIEEELASLDRELRQMTVLPLIAVLRQKAEAIRQRELERTLGYLRAADPQIIEHVQHLSHSLVNGLLHGPTVSPAGTRHGWSHVGPRRGGSRFVRPGIMSATTAQRALHVGTRTSARPASDRIGDRAASPRLAGVALPNQGIRHGWRSLHQSTLARDWRQRRLHRRGRNICALTAEIDVAVHSLKDLPVEESSGLTIGAILEREDVRDVLVAKNGWTLATLPNGAVVGTCSLRRECNCASPARTSRFAKFAATSKPGHRKVTDGEFDATVLAAAGVLPGSDCSRL